MSTTGLISRFLPLLWLLQFTKTFAWVVPPIQTLVVPTGGDRGNALSASSSETSASQNEKPTLVVGATGRVGRQIVRKLMAQNKPVRALVRDKNKARALFGTCSGFLYPPLEIYQADLGRFDRDSAVLSTAVQGCGSIISVSGIIRFSKWSDFLPWRLFRMEKVASWAKRDHPYYGNFLAQKKLMELAERNNVDRFVRLTGLALAYSAFNPITILFNTLLSCSNRWNSKFEEALVNSNVPYVIIRPGGLAKDARNTETTNVQVDASGKVPLPGRIGRADVADLCIAATEVVPSNKSYTLACRWVGPDVKPRAQGTKEEGFASSTECLQEIVRSNAGAVTPSNRMKPYGAAVSLAVYGFLAIVLKFLLFLGSIFQKVTRIV